MTFGEHLEALRVHLWKAIIGLIIGSVVAFSFSRQVIIAIQQPVIAAMENVFMRPTDAPIEKGPLEAVGDWWARIRGTAPEPEPVVEKKSAPSMMVEIDAREIARKLNELNPQAYPPLPDDARHISIALALEGTPLGDLLTSLKEDPMHPRTDAVDEAFMIYLKVSLILGVVISSPWILYQLWLFIGAGLYSHERKYVYTYFPMSVILFLGGALFCFFLVIPTVLSFLFEFNRWLHIRPELKISGWITFALVVSLMFGISFQLPLVMLFLERISLVSTKLYREKRRHAILIIAFLSMVLTPSDPISMMMMMFPLCILYELGILLCGRGSIKKSPFEALPA